jgi:hypothetical protein
VHHKSHAVLAVSAYIHAPAKISNAGKIAVIHRPLNIVFGDATPLHLQPSVI